MIFVKKFSLMKTKLSLFVGNVLMSYANFKKFQIRREKMALNDGYLKASIDKNADEYYTPDYAILPLLKYLEKTPYKKIWCPFDTEQSGYVQIFKNNGYDVIYSHIKDGKDFFKYEPDNFDVIISNPPFSIKDSVLKKLYEIDKPYAMLMPIGTLQGQKRFKYLKDCQALIFNKRINFYIDDEKKIMKKGVSFASFYLCKNFLDKDLIFEEIKEN